MEKIFLSSTWAFMESYREKVREALERLRHVGFELEWYGMEAFPASPNENSLEASLRFVSESDVFVGILGRRYGTVVAEHDKSVVELEYFKAVERGMPRYLFLMCEDSQSWADIGPEDEPSRREALSQLRNRFREDRLLDHFDTPGDLAMKVATALLQTLMGAQTAAISRRIDAILPRAEEGQASGIALTASPALIPADGRSVATVTATVTNLDGIGVADGERLLWDLSGTGVMDRSHSVTQAGISSISVRPERSDRTGRMLVTCIAIESGTAASIVVDYYPPIDLSWPVEPPTFAVQLVATSRREEAFGPQIRVKQFSGSPVPDVWIRLAGPRFSSSDWRVVTGDTLERTTIGGQFDLRLVALNESGLGDDEMGVEIRFPWADGWAHELHRFPMSRRELPNKVLWDIGEERLPPLRWRED